MYWKWEAANKNGEIFTGVDESARFELIVLKLEQQQLFVTLIESIDHSEFKTRRTIEAKLDKFKHYRETFNPAPASASAARSTHIRSSKMAWALTTVAISLLVLLAFHCFR